MSTLKEISRRSGYSVTTVSRALNGHDDVTRTTRERIEAVARGLNYSPNQVARKLVSGRSGMVGLVLAAPPDAFEHGHFFHIVAGLSQAFSSRGMDFVLHVGTGGDEIETYERLISRGTLDGYIVTSPRVADPRIRLLLDRTVPFVVHGRDPTQDGHAGFDLDNFAVSRIAVAHLTRLGHTRIALVNGPADRAYAHERLRGFTETLGGPARPDLILHGDTSEAYGRDSLARLMAVPDPPTAIVCCNSLVARGIYDGAAAAGLAIPHDLSVIAHDDDLPQAVTARLDPPLTVTQAPLAGAAEALADLLVRRIAGTPPEALGIQHQATFVRRTSTAVPRNRLA